MTDLERQAHGLLQALLSVPFESCAAITREFRGLPLLPGLYAVRHREVRYFTLVKKSCESGLGEGAKPALGHGWMSICIRRL